MEWISVKKEMPNLGFEVIVNDKHGQVSSGWLILEEGEKLFVDADGVEFKYITHWQPLSIGIVSENL